MKSFDLHWSGNCWPDTCPQCAMECAVCGEWRFECTCPTLPIDTEDDE